MSIALRGVGLAHANGKVALENIDLEVSPGERVAIIGPSGAGKTTLLRLLATSLQPTQGEIDLLQHNPWRLAARQRQRLRARIGLIHQAPPLPPRQRVITAVLAGKLGQWSLAKGLLNLLYPLDACGAQAALARLDDPAAPHNPDSHGARVCRRYGVLGAREQAQHGFPAVIEHGLPQLLASRRASAGEQNKLKTGGVRLALVAPVLTSRERIKQVEQDWKKLGTPAASKATGSKDNKDPVAEIASIASGVQDDALKQQLEKLRGDLRANTQARDEQRDQAIRSELQLGAFLCTKLKDDGMFLDTLEGNYKRSCGAGEDDQMSRCDARKEQLEGHRKVLDFMLNYYADTVVSGALNYTSATVEPQVSVVAQQMAARSKSNLRSYLDTHWKNLNSYMKSGKVARSQWLESCKSI